MENRYRKEVENLKQALDRNDARAEASEHLRGLTGKIVLTPEPRRDQLRIDLHGDLAGILQIASQKQVRPGNTLDSGPNKIALVAGARNSLCAMFAVTGLMPTKYRPQTTA